METSETKTITFLTAGLATGLLFMGALRFSVAHPTVLTPVAGYATAGYIAVTAIFAILLSNAGLPHNRFGFGDRLNLRHVQVAVAAIAVLQVINLVFNPWLEELLGGGRNLERFAGIEGSVSALAMLLQATIFGLIHAYQGQAGIVGSAISGLVFGAVTIAARWSIWPAALAHGGNNTFGIIALYLGAD